jgi:hypothetical protein
MSWYDQGMFRRVIAITLGLAASVGTPGLAHATMMAPLDLKQLSQRADRVVVGTVERSVSSWTADHSAIYTEVTVRVDHSVKGAAKPGERVVVQREGGTVNGIGMRVFGAAELAVGEEVVLFLEHRGAASFVVGMAQGKLAVRTLADGRKAVLGSYEGLAFTDGATHAPIHGRLLEDLEHEVRGYIGPRSTR